MPLEQAACRWAGRAGSPHPRRGGQRSPRDQPLHLRAALDNVLLQLPGRWTSRGSAEVRGGGPT